MMENNIGNWIFSQKKFSTVSLTDATQRNAIHILGWIACNNQNTQTFYDLHTRDSTHSDVYKPQGMIWEWLNLYKGKLPESFPSYVNGSYCWGCYKYNGYKYLLNEDTIKTILNDGKEYTVTVDFFYKKNDARQKLMHLSATSTDTKKNVKLEFSKINTAGNGVAGAKLNLSSNTSGITLSSNSLTSAADGKFGTVKVTPTTNNGYFKIKLTETAPNGYLGIPNDVVLTVSYDNGIVTRNKCRNSN